MMLLSKSPAQLVRSILLLTIAVLTQGCTQPTVKNDSVVQVSEDFGVINDVPDLPPPPDSKKYQLIRDELSAS